AEYAMLWPRRTTLIPASSRPPNGRGQAPPLRSRHPVLLLVGLELGLGGLEVRHPVPVREVEEEVGLAGGQAGLDRRLARVGDRARRQPGVGVGVVRR